MTAIRGHHLVAQSLRKAGVDTLFFLSGGPMLDVQRDAHAAGIRLLDVRHEQAAAMMANAWSRLTHKVGVCMAASGPGTTNLVTGVANAFIDRAPLVVLGGSSPVSTYGQGDFQEIDQMEMMRPITKAAIRVHRTERIPEHIRQAMLLATTGQPGPVYLDFPGDVLYGEVIPDKMVWPNFDLSVPRNPADPDAVGEAVRLLKQARRPVALTGSGALASASGEQLMQFLRKTGMPLFTTPMGRGIVPEDDAVTPIAARSRAFREADLVLVLGTRLNWVVGYGRPPRFSPDVKLIQVDTDAAELTRHPQLAVRLQGDAGRVLSQLLAGITAGDPSMGLDRAWVEGLQANNREKLASAHQQHLNLQQTPIHPLRLCAELAEVLPRDSILTVDGSEILNYARHSIPTYYPGHRMNSGPFGCLGTGIPFGLGAKLACPDKTVVTLTGDGSFGLNGMEIDTAVGHKLNVVIVVSNNGGWASDSGTKPWRRLGFVRYDLVAAALGAHGEFVQTPDEIRPALERALAARRPACVNVVTDPKAHASTAAFASYEYA